MAAIQKLFPRKSSERRQWVLDRRPVARLIEGPIPRNSAVDWSVECEPNGTGQMFRCLTVFIVSRECPWRCVFCDLWRYAAPSKAPIGSPFQQLVAVTRSDSVQDCDCIKIYNAGSFFDFRAIPRSEIPAIAAACRGFSKVVVECHPKLISPAVWEFRDMILPARLEVALGLETANETTLVLLNKGSTVDDFNRSAMDLRNNGVGVRAFVLVRPPFLDSGAGLEWVFRSVEFAFDAGAAVVSLIPTRMGNGSLDSLAHSGHFVPPRLAELEAALEYGLRLRRGLVFADIWELDRWAATETDFAIRKNRLMEMNQRQEILSSISPVEADPIV